MLTEAASQHLQEMLERVLVQIDDLAETVGFVADNPRSSGLNMVKQASHGLTDLRPVLSGWLSRLREPERPKARGPRPQRGSEVAPGH